MSSEELLKFAHQGDLKQFIELIAAGADINCREINTEFTPLHIAVAKRHTDLFRYIISVKDTLLFPEDAWERTPAMLAILKGGSNFAAEIAKEAHRRHEGFDSDPSP